MKNLDLKRRVIFVLLGAIIFVGPVAHAQSPQYTIQPCEISPGGILGGRCEKVNADGSTTICTQVSVGVPAVIPGPKACETTYKDGAKCSSTDIGVVDSYKCVKDGQVLNSGVNGPVEKVGAAMANTAVTVAAELVGFIAGIILGLAHLLLGLAGAVFNWTMYATVFQFGNLIGNSPGMLAAWGVLRDLGNLLILFGFIFMGIATILDLQNYAAKKALPRLIIFAVLMNFSLLAAEAIIDTSNVFASVLYNQSSICGATMTKDECAKNVGLSGAIIQSLGVADAWGISRFHAKPVENAVITTGLAVFVTISAVVLIAGIVLLVIRAVVLAFLMVTSPIGFAGLAVPPLRKFADMWWKKLLAQAFFAPIYILMIMISLKLMEGMRVALGAQSGQSYSLAGALQNLDSNTSNIGVFMIFALLTGFMIASLIAAKSMGATGAGMAINTAGKITGMATFGVAGFAGRRVIGSTSARFASAVRNSKFGATEGGRFLAGIGDKGAHASYDMRTTKPFGAVVKPTGVDFGKPGKTAAGGWHAIEEKAVKERTDYAKSLELSEQQEAEEKRLKAEKKSLPAAWNKRSKELDAQIEEAEAKLAATKEAAIEPLKKRKDLSDQLVNERKIGADAFARGDMAAADESKRKIEELQTQLSGLAAAAAEASKNIDADTQALEEVKNMKTTGEKRTKERLEQIEVDIVHNNPKLRYAEHLESRIPYGKVRGVQVDHDLSVGGHADHAAAKAITKRANMSDIERALDTIKKNTEKKEKGHGDDDEEGGAHPPPPSPSHAAPAPPGGGADHPH